MFYPQRSTGDSTVIVAWPVINFTATDTRCDQPIVTDLIITASTDKGQDLSKGARFSVTNYESSFHTDNSFGSAVLDYVGLLCLQNAKAGGVSQVMSCHAVHDELARHHPAEL
ncbi:MAG: TauD/TfdA family dioxygenase, partial [Burkholderiales bacterium]|nr:TauD/TfdA family dioxygenase [Burkholderiales bacterium]